MNIFTDMRTSHRRTRCVGETRRRPKNGDVKLTSHFVGGHDPAWPFVQHYHGLNGSSEADHMNRLMYIDLKTQLVDAYMEKTDKEGQARGSGPDAHNTAYRLRNAKYRF